MNYIKRYLKKHIKLIVLFAFVVLVFFVIFVNYGVELRAIIYPSVLTLIMALFLAAFGVIRDKKRHKIVEDIILKKADVDESVFPEPLNAVEDDYLKLIKLLKEEIVNRECEYEEKNRNLSDYYTMWVHQVKTPIASMKLKLSETDSESARLISSDLRRIEQYVDMVLTYVRLNSESTDYVFKKIKADDVIKPSVRKFSHDFISKKLSLSYEGSDIELLTDEKWLGFVIEQLLSNAVKYTKEGGITISVTEDDRYAIISIKDTGIGIPAENLPRIFESGYTGLNGRTDSHSSGIGLYICKKICDNLGITVKVLSEVSKGSEFLLMIPKESGKFE